VFGWEVLRLRVKEKLGERIEGGEEREMDTAMAAGI
jgi:hypothetical protein